MKDGKGDDDVGQSGQCMEKEQGFFNLYFTPHIVDAEYLRGAISVQLYREHPVQEGLDRVAMYNMSMLQVYLI